MNKKKVLMLSDHALSTSGVGTQSRFLINGLLSKDRWTFRQFGAALKHTDYETIAINEDFIIKPIDGFGNPELLRIALATEKPDVLFLFTDPRFFIWLFEMEDEVHKNGLENRCFVDFVERKNDDYCSRQRKNHHHKHRHHLKESE